MKVGIQNSQSSFNGRTKIFAITDTHQETRKTGAFLSKILSASMGKKNVLFLHDGDLFKGIYKFNEYEINLIALATMTDSEYLTTTRFTDNDKTLLLNFIESNNILLFFLSKL